jgi:hypothetical protein
MKIFATLLVLALVAMPAFPQAATTVSTVVFKALFCPSHETPPISGSYIFGDGEVEMTLTMMPPGTITQAIVDFRVKYWAETPQNLTAMHIHRGAAGVAGPVVVDSRFGTALAASGQGAVFRSNIITDPTTLAVIEAILENPENYYLNLHSTTNPAGIIRGQLIPDLSLQVGQRLNSVQTQLDLTELMLRGIGRALGLIFPTTVPETAP